MTVKTRTYILELMDGGRRKLTIPATWKITFGNVLPYNKTTGGSYEPPHGWSSRVVLRVYEGNKDNLRAVMHDVLSFHEETVKILETRPKKVMTSRLKEVDGKQDVELKEMDVNEWYDPLIWEMVPEDDDKQKVKKYAKRSD